jgi:hypothetical protein
MNASRYILGRSVHIALFLALSLLLLVPAIAAQDDANEAHPAHIHSGTCDELGDVVYPLADVVTLSTSSRHACHADPATIGYGGANVRKGAPPCPGST